MSECSCNVCQNACKYNPGWFLPGEAEKAAEHMGLSLKEFFDKFLVVNWWVGIPDDTYVLSPATVNSSPGREANADPSGRCIFFKEGKCSIHAVKPFECREYIHSQQGNEIYERHEQVAMAWEEHQDQIIELLGREPVSEELPSRFDSWW